MKKKAIKNTASRPPGRPKATQIFVHKLDKIIAAKSRLGLPEAVLTFRDIRREIYNRSGVWVSLGTVQRFVDGIEPVKERIRKAFGLACKVEIYPCKKCGEIHLPKRCTANHKPRPRAYRYTEYPVWTLSDLTALAVAQPDARVVVLGVGAEFESVRVGWERNK